MRLHLHVSRGGGAQFLTFNCTPWPCSNKQKEDDFNRDSITIISINVVIDYSTSLLSVEVYAPTCGVHITHQVCDSALSF